MLGNQISNMVMVLGLSQILRRFDLTTPKAVMYIRIMYFVSQALQLLAWMYIRRLVRKGRKEEATMMLEVAEPAKPFSNEAPKKQRMSIRDYDLAEVAKHLNQVAMGAVFMSVLHFWFKFTQPLIFNSILPWKNFFTLPVVQIRLFGWKAEGSLARPWKTPNPLGDLLGQSDDGAAAKKDDAQEREESDGRKERKERETIEAKSESEAESSTTKARKPARRED